VSPFTPAGGADLAHKDGKPAAKEGLRRRRDERHAGVRVQM
jgi:hypothetical protein